MLYLYEFVDTEFDQELDVMETGNGNYTAASIQIIWIPLIIFCDELLTLVLFRIWYNIIISGQLEEIRECELSTSAHNENDAMIIINIRSLTTSICLFDDKNIHT